MTSDSTNPASPLEAVNDEVVSRLADGSGEFVSGVRLAALLLVLALSSALWMFDQILPFILAEPIKAALNLSDTQLGLVSGLAFAICYCLASLPLARLSDRGSPKTVLICCILAWSVMTWLGGLSTGFFFLTLTRLGFAFGEAGALPAGHALIARKIVPERRGLALGLFSMGIPLGGMLGFTIGGAIGNSFGWRTALTGAGIAGCVIALLASFVIRRTPPLHHAGSTRQSFLRTSLTLLSAPQFRWLFIGANVAGLASTPFYAFVSPFLIRTHGLTVAEAGLAVGLLQGVLGVFGTLLGGRGFDHAVKAGRGFLTAPSIVFLVAGTMSVGALFSPFGWLSVVLFAPSLFAFAFLLPSSFGTSHVVAGHGNQALASSLMVIGTGLVGAIIGPLFVGVVSDAVGASGENGLRVGMLIIPVAEVLTGVSYLVANHRVVVWLRKS